MRVAIDARIPVGVAGGVAQVVVGLAQGFAAARPPDLHRLWLAYPDVGQWLTPHLPDGDEVLVVQTTIERIGAGAARRFPAMTSGLRPHVERVLDRAGRGRGAAGPLDARLQALGVEVVHLPFQDGLLTSLPFVYHPHDLQHRYLPEFFSRAQVAHRESAWRDRATRAAAVSVGTEAVADDVCRMWGIARERVHVVPLAPIGLDVNEKQMPQTLGTPLVLYPAAFWAHKNHVTLIRAIAALRERGVPVQLVLPGAPVGVYRQVRRAVLDAGLDSATTLPGYVSEGRLRELYAQASVVAVPSRFEAASFPIWEAFARGKPVVAARTTSLPRQVGGGGLIVDPTDVEGFADAIGRLLADDVLRGELGEAGRARVSEFTWARTALASTALYRLASGHSAYAQEEDALVNAPIY
jgi:glycosyltransferase involved in cell wall biosynthesis